MKNTFYSFLIIFLLKQTVLVGQAPADSTISYVASWQKGEIKKYKVTKNKIEYRNGQETKNETSSYVASFEIKSVNKKSYTIEYQYQNQLLNTAPELTSGVKAITAKYNLQKVKYTTDELGAFKGIENWKEISAMTKEIFNQVISDSPPEKKDNLKKMMEPLIAAYSSKEGIESLLLNELSYFHSPYGGLFSLHDTISYEESLPNLFGGAPLKALGKVYFKEEKDKRNNHVLINELAVDEQDGLRAVEEMLAKASAKLTYKSKEEADQKAANLKKEFAQMKMDIKDFTTYTYDQKTSWPVSLTYKRHVLVNTPQEKGERINELLIEPVD